MRNSSHYYSGIFECLANPWTCRDALGALVIPMTVLILGRQIRRIIIRDPGCASKKRNHRITATFQCSRNIKNIFSGLSARRNCSRRDRDA